MARGVNKVILIGNLGADPEVRYTPGGSAVANITLATSSAWRDKTSGQLQERTEWHRIVFFNRLAEIVGEYLHKGSKIYIEGCLRTRKWQDKSGVDRYTTEIISNEMQILDSKNSNHSASSNSNHSASSNSNHSASSNSNHSASSNNSNFNSERKSAGNNNKSNSDNVGNTATSGESHSFHKQEFEEDDIPF